MTIAAGFYYQDGILLCADTEQTLGTLKFNRPKISTLICDRGTFGFAYAGHSHFAQSTVQKLTKRLNESADDTDSIIGETLEEDYTRLVLNHPNVSFDPNLHYALLIAVCSADGRRDLYRTDQCSHTRVDGYDCIGVGEILAHYLIPRSFIPEMPESWMVYRAAFMLANVKETTAGCGGHSQFCLIRKDGTCGQFVAQKRAREGPRTGVEWLGEQALEFDSVMRNVLFFAADRNISDASFGVHLENVRHYLETLRRDYRSRGLALESFATFQASPEGQQSD